MTGADNSRQMPADDEWARLWRDDTRDAASSERAARITMAHVWRFDQKIFWRNAREYAAGLALMGVFLYQIAAGDDRTGGVLGLICVGFVMAYLWWNHRGMQPLDPVADLTAYRNAALNRYDAQIRLLRAVTYWYLLPLMAPMLWQVSRTWATSPWSAVAIVIVDVAVFLFIRWLNVTVATGVLRAGRAKMAAMLPEE
jgi:hypothetical protein